MVPSNISGALEDEYNLMLQAVQNQIARRENANQPLLLQIQRESAEGRDQVTVLLGHVVPDQDTSTREWSGSGGDVGASSLSPPLMAELGPLLLRALALQIIFGEQRRRMASPLEQEAVGRLQRMILTYEVVVQLESEGRGVCSICQESLVSGSEVYRLPCGHIFDVQCLRRWLEQTRTCPNCRFRLEDVEQQYKDAFTPVWWSSAANNENGSEIDGCQRAVTMDREPPGGNLSALPEAVDVITGEANNQSSQQNGVVVGEEHSLRQQLLEILPTPVAPPRSLSSLLGASNGTGEVLSTNNFNDSLFPAIDTTGTGLTQIEPVPPGDEPRRVGGSFRAGLFAEEVRIPPLSTHSTGSRVARPLSQNSRRLQCSPLERGAEQISLLTRSPQPPLSSPGLLDGAELPLNDRIGAGDFSLLSRETFRNNSDHNLSASLLRTTPCPPGETQTSRRAPLTRSVPSNQPQPQTQPTGMAGSARQAVQALRRNREAELQSFRLSQHTNNNVSVEVALGRPRRYRSSIINRPVMRSPPRSVQLTQQREVRRVSQKAHHQQGGNSVNNVVEPGESPAPSESRPQTIGRGSRRNLTQYESIIRGHQHR